MNKVVDIVEFQDVIKGKNETKISNFPEKEMMESLMDYCQGIMNTAAEIAASVIQEAKLSKIAFSLQEQMSEYMSEVMECDGEPERLLFTYYAFLGENTHCNAVALG
ncbi:MAG: hypothetical protein LUG21_00415 [Clostridiales bacterium]|nr:hypothetical protein [Clostridiales bacterium]